MCTWRCCFLPLAAAKITLSGRDIITHAPVAKSLPVAALLGWDVPELMQFVTLTTDTELDNAGNELAVVTPRQKESHDSPPSPSVANDSPVINDKTLMEDPDPVISTDSNDSDAVTEDPSASTANDAEYLEDNTETLMTEFPIDDSLFSPPGPDKQVLTPSQKRAARCRYQTPNKPPNNLQSFDISAKQLRSLQETDPTLEHAQLVADGKCSSVAGWEFVRRDGLLYRHYNKPGHNETPAAESLVLRMPLCQPVTELAHNTPVAGHLGWRKTTARILYWPGIYCDVRDHCQACEQC